MMTERRDDEMQGSPTQEANPARIRFLTEKKKSRSGLYLAAFLLLLAAIAYAFMAPWALRLAGVRGATDVAPLAPSLLFDRVWIDEIPQRDTDTFNFYVFSSEDNFGVNDHALSVYKHVLELFFYRASGETTLQFQFPHDRRQARTTYKVEKMAKPRGDLDLKLTIDKDPQMGGKTQVYFSSTRWSSHDLQSLPTALRGPVGQALRSRGMTP